MLGFVVLRFFSSIPAITSMLAVTSISALSALSAVAAVAAVSAVAILLVIAMGALFVANLLSCLDTSLRSGLDSSSSATSGGVE